MNKEEVEDYLNSSEKMLAVGNFLDDEHAKYALGMIRKLIQKPDIPSEVAHPTIIQLQSIAAQSKMLAKYYMTIGKSEPDSAHHKNLYFSLAEELDKLVMALKKGV